MEARFEVKTTMTLEAMTALQKASQAKWSRILLWVSAIVCTVGSIVIWALDGEDKILPSAVTLLVWAMALFLDRFHGWLFYRGRNRAVEEIGYRFSDGEAQVQNALEEAKLGYGAFVKLMEDDKYFFLFVQKHAAHILPKADFTQGDPADFAAFIAEKTGLEVKQV